VGGVDPYALSARRAARLVAVVPQDVAPAFSFSVLEMVLMGRSPYVSSWGRGGEEDWARSREAMQAAGVQHLADRPVDELSGGERQRVVLAQALAQDAPVLLLDEPTTHLDVRHVLDVLAVVRRLATSEGRTVLAIFHDLNLASAFCDRIAVISEGRIVIEGTPAEVLTTDRIRAVFGIDAEVWDAGTGRPTVLLPPASMEPAAVGASRVHVIGGAGRGASIIRALAEAGFDVSAGVLHAGDTDAIVAERLNVARIIVPSFSVVDAEQVEDCIHRIGPLHAFVLCDVPFGPGNVANLHLAQALMDRGVPGILLDGTPVEDRDFTGGLATTLWRAIRARASVVSDAAQVVAAARAGAASADAR